ncbi:MAG: hypothetical protein ABIK07_11450 [Planctomycetota bacterium]
MSEFIRKGLICGSSVSMVILILTMCITNFQSTPVKEHSLSEHFSKELSIYTVSMFNEMLQSYCKQYDLKADHQGPLSPDTGRSGNRPVPDYDQYVTWVICPQKTEPSNLMSRFHRNDWFTIGLCHKDQAEFEVLLMGGTLPLKLPSTYGKYTGLNTTLPNQMSVNEFMTEFSAFSRTYQTREEVMREIWDRFTRIDEENECSLTL